MNCLNCKSDKLICQVNAVVALPHALKGGTVLTKGFVVTQKDVKDWWDKDMVGDERKIRGPIICADCLADHTYFRGIQPSLRQVPYAEAVANGYDHYAAGSTKTSSDSDNADE